MAVHQSISKGLHLAVLASLALGAGPALSQSFNLTVLPPVASACANNTVSVSVKVTSFDGFTGHVVLSAPQGSNYVHNGFIPQPISPFSFFPDTANFFVYFHPTAAGPITIPITGTPNFGSGASPKTVLSRFNITPSLIGVVLQPYTPKANQTDIGWHPRFAWTDFPGVTFGVELDDDGVVPAIEALNTPLNEVRFDTALEPSTQYMFTTQAVNSCSTTNRLIVNATTAQACFLVDQPIPDNGTLVSTVGIAGNVAENLRLTLGIDHARAGDLKVTLRRLDRTAVVMDRPGFPATANGCNKANVDVVLRDGEPINNENQCEGLGPAMTGPMTPSQPMSIFEGVPATGNWELTVQDMAPGQTGRLYEWCLSSGNSPGDTPFVEFNDDVMVDGFEQFQ